MRTTRRTLAVIAVALVPSIAAAQQHEVVRGRVTTDSGRTVAGATVLVTRLADRQTRTTASDSGGRYTMTWDGTGASYVVSVSAPGFATANSAAKRQSTDSVFVVNVVLQHTAARQLAAVVTQAQRVRPPRDASGVVDPSASEIIAIPINAARRLAPDQAGDLASIVSLSPGVMPVAGGVSVLGLGAGQNSTTLNGMAFPGADVPRDAFTRVRFTTSSYDPSIGWFSGARTQVDLVPGGLFTSRDANLTFDTPAAQYNDPISARLGQRYTNVNGSIGGMGQLVDDRWAYNYGAQGGHRTSSYATLGSAPADLLAHAGLAADSAAKLLSALQRAGVPLAAPAGQTDDNVSFIGRIDHAPYDWRTLKASPTTWGITGYGKLSRSQGAGLAPTGTAAHAGSSSTAMGFLQGELSSYLGDGGLADFRSGVSFNRNANSPYVALPDGSVLVESTLDSGATAPATLLFGGNSLLGGSSRTWTWENIADVQLYGAGAAAHRVRLSGDVRYDAAEQDPATNSLGTFVYPDLASVAANAPSAFTRTLGTPTRSSAAWNAFAAVGDAWRPLPNLAVRYGARVDGNRFAKAPAYNPAVDSAFGLRTNLAPDRVGLSPRLGFSWDVPGAQGRPRGSLHGGAGEFRNMLDPSLLGAASVSTGLPDGVRQLECFGSAVPVPQWSTYAADAATIPAQCTNAGGAFAQSAPLVRVFDPGFAPSRSWRESLGWSSVALHMPFTIDGMLSENLDQRGVFDLNFAGVPKFVTSDEGRPVFADAAGISTASGVVSPTSTRRTGAFSQVLEGVSDLQSVSRQLTVTVRPYVPRAAAPYVGDFIVGYTLSGVRDRLRGFDLSTFGDPRDADWARGALDARHQFVVQGVVRPHPGWLLFVAGRAQSGLPYTPMVRTDVNGDGLPNDRAFVFDPAHAPDSATAAGMRSLLAGASGNARSCLLSQLGQAAGRGSCVGPWTASLNAGLHLVGSQVLHNDRIDLVINFANPLGGLDQLLHGADHLRGWGTAATPDPVLLDVRGFDPGARRFLYTVNQRFGGTAPSLSTIRAPFRVTIDLSLDIAPPQVEQQIDRWLRPGRRGHAGARVAATDLVRRFQRTVPDPYAEVLQESDTLLLSSQQVGELQRADESYRVRIDSIWTDVGVYLGALPDDYDPGAAFRRTDASTDEAWEITRVAMQGDFRRILTPAQLAMLPLYSRLFWNARDRMHLRIYPNG